MNLDEIDPGGREDPAGAAFRLLRAQLAEMYDLCIALATESAGVHRIWRRIVKNAQLQLHVDGCTFYRVIDGVLVPELVLSRSLGFLTDEPDHTRLPLAPLPLWRPDGTPDLSSAAARVVHSRSSEHLPDIAQAPPEQVRLTAEFDRVMGYRTRSLLTVPVCYRDETPLGVLQLVNAHDAAGEPVAFDTQRERIAQALASLIAIAAKLP